MPLTSALKILDQFYVRMAPVKGSFTWWNPRIIIVTSNSHPSTWYDYSKRQEKEAALRRRFTKVYHGADLALLDTPEAIKKWWPIAFSDEAEKPKEAQTLANNYLTSNASLNAFESTQAMNEDRWVPDSDEDGEVYLKACEAANMLL